MNPPEGRVLGAGPPICNLCLARWSSQTRNRSQPDPESRSEGRDGGQNSAPAAPRDCREGSCHLVPLLHPTAWTSSNPLLLQLAVGWKGPEGGLGGPEVSFSHGTQLWMCLPCPCNLRKEVTLSVSRVTPKALSSVALSCHIPRAPSYMLPQASL